MGTGKEKGGVSMRMIRFWCALLAIFVFGTHASAHEVRPSIADLSSDAKSVVLSVTLNAEAILSGADLNDIQDTDALDQSDQIDAMRATSNQELTVLVGEKADQLASAIRIDASGSPVFLRLTDTTVNDEPDLSLPRDTVLVFQGDLPAGTSELTVTWPAEWGMLVLRQQGVEEPFTGYLSGGVASDPIVLAGGGAQSGWDSFLSYIPVGFDHIVPMGLDHILFVLGLFFLTSRLGPLLWQISAFTLAHTVTLALGALGLVNIPGHIVEPLIAASIVFVALENIFSNGMSKWRPVVVFLFGLLHGLGFASVLGEFGLPQGQFIPALLGFNVGVEVGQLFVIACAFLIVWIALRVDALEMTERTGQVFYGVLTLIFIVMAFLLKGTGFETYVDLPAPAFFLPLAFLSALCILSATNVDKLEAYRNYVAIPASCFIALVGAYWFVERVFL